MQRSYLRGDYTATEADCYFGVGYATASGALKSQKPKQYGVKGKTWRRLASIGRILGR